METGHLVTMANQIGAFYETMPDRKKALDDIADHIRKFWDPRMRRALLACVDAPGAPEHGLTPILIEALRLNRNSLEPH